MSNTENSVSDAKRNLDDPEKSLDNPNYFLNRELSWIRFNARVLEEARDPWHPLLERVKFIAICGSNLDEFFMTRIPRLIKKVRANSSERSNDGMTAMEQIEATRAEILPLIEKHARCWNEELVPALAKEAIHIERFSKLGAEKKEALREYFRKTILPAMKIPKAAEVNPSAIGNLRVNLAVQTESTGKDSVYVVEVPTEEFSRLIRIPNYEYSVGSSKENEGFEFDFVFLEDLVASNLDLLFPDSKTIAAYPLRLTRNGEIDILMDESSDFMVLVKKSLQNRKAGFPSRLEFDKRTPQAIRTVIAATLGLQNYLLYEFDGPLGLVDLWQLLKISRPDLKDKTFIPSISPLLTPNKNILAAISKRDIVLYHPYDSFEIIVELLKEAAADRHVVEICITMRRCRPASTEDSPPPDG